MMGAGKLLNKWTGRHVHEWSPWQRRTVRIPCMFGGYLVRSERVQVCASCLKEKRRM